MDYRGALVAFARFRRVEIVALLRGDPFQKNSPARADVRADAKDRQAAPIDEIIDLPPEFLVSVKEGGDFVRAPERIVCSALARRLAASCAALSSKAARVPFCRN